MCFFGCFSGFSTASPVQAERDSREVVGVIMGAEANEPRRHGIHGVL